jgi:chromosome partitioning protein
MPAKIATIANEKGGVSKTTICFELAVNAMRNGLKVIVVDTDPQQSSVKWKMRRTAVSPDLPTIKVLPIIGLSVGTQIRELATECDLLLVDAGGRDSQEMRLAMLTSHLVVIPTTCSDMDLDGLNRMAMIVNEVRLSNPALEAWVLLTKIKASQTPSTARAAVEEALEREIAPGLPAMHSVLNGLMTAHTYFRQACDDAYSWGRSVQEMDRRNAKAVSESIAVYQEVMRHG